MVKDVAPYETGPLFRELCSSDSLRRQLSSDDDSDEETVDNTLMESLSECYQVASNWETRRQILSIMADKVRYNKLLRFIPGLTKYCFTEAKRHCLADVVEKLGDAGEGMSWAKDIQSRLPAGKRYLKSDYKVGYLSSPAEMIYFSYLPRDKYLGH